MIVVCINRLQFFNITIGKKYLVIDKYIRGDGHYFIINDDLGAEVGFNTKYFKPLTEMRRNKLKKVCL